MTPDLMPIMCGVALALLLAAGTVLACMAVSSWWRGYQRRRLR